MDKKSEFTIIEDTEKAREEFGYNYGGGIYEILRDDLKALAEGKMLATTINDEYSIFIRLG